MLLTDTFLFKALTRQVRIYCVTLSTFMHDTATKQVIVQTTSIPYRFKLPADVRAHSLLLISYKLLLQLDNDQIM